MLLVLVLLPSGRGRAGNWARRQHVYALVMANARVFGWLVCAVLGVCRICRSRTGARRRTRWSSAGSSCCASASSAPPPTPPTRASPSIASPASEGTLPLPLPLCSARTLVTLVSCLCLCVLLPLPSASCSLGRCEYWPHLRIHTLILVLSAECRVPNTTAAEWAALEAPLPDAWRLSSSPSPPLPAYLLLARSPSNSASLWLTSLTLTPSPLSFFREANL